MKQNLIDDMEVYINKVKVSKEDKKLIIDINNNKVKKEDAVEDAVLVDLI